MVEVHPDPGAALSDGDQSLTLEMFADLMRAVGPVAEAVGRRVLTS
jgi:3-deoxy-7-phosphoheptulonate synthase